jgi:nicotinate-nucleotide adenylyltransferase
MGRVDRCLLCGGSFDPIHHGHLIVSRFVAEQLDIPRVILIPGARPPHKPDRKLAPPADRLAMCRLAVAGDPRFEVSDWELGQEGPNYTLNTIEHYRSVSPAGTELCWLVGMDSLRELHTWYEARRLVESCTIVSTARPGFPRPEASELAAGFTPTQVEKLLRHIVEGPRVDIAGTDIRARVRAGLSIRYLVPEPVGRYVEERGLYR